MQPPARPAEQASLLPQQQLTNGGAEQQLAIAEAGGTEAAVAVHHTQACDRTQQPQQQQAYLLPLPPAAHHLFAAPPLAAAGPPLSPASAPPPPGFPHASKSPSKPPQPGHARRGHHEHFSMRALHHVAPKLSKQLHKSHQSLFEDIVFDESLWEKHRSSWHRHRVEPLLFVRVALGFFWQIFLVVLISVAVGLYQEFIVPLGAPSTTAGLATVFTLLTFALSLLLVFKTNSSYARWWEGRIVWGQVVNCTRNYARMLLQYAPPSQRDLCHLGITWTIAAPHVLRGYIRQMGPNAIKEAAHVLSAEEMHYLSQWKNPPAGVARVMSWVVSELDINMEQQRILEEQVISYVNNAGACERIYKTPIPAAYARHTSRFLMIFLSFAPILLWQSAQWCTPVVVGVVAFLLLGTENIGVQIEEPFRVLPLEAISKAIENNVKEMEEENWHGTRHKSLSELRSIAAAQVAARQTA